MGKKQRKAHHCKSQRFKSLPWCVLHLQDFTHSERVLYWIHKRAGSCKENIYEALVGRAGLMYRDSTVKVHILPSYDIYKCKDMFCVMWPQVSMIMETFLPVSMAAQRLTLPLWWPGTSTLARLPVIFILFARLNSASSIKIDSWGFSLGI